MSSNLKSKTGSSWLWQSGIYRAGWMSVLFCIPSALAQTAPTVITQPQGQSATAGNSVTFWVTVTDGSSPSLPSVSSGTLQLWLKADTGVVTNSSGLVSQWHDQSGNTNDASQTASNNQPT